MSYLFDGVNDEAVFTSTDFRFGTIVMVCKLAVAGAWFSLMEFESGGGALNGAFLRHNGGDLSFNNGAVNLTAVAFANTDGWCVIATKKATGTVAATNYKIPIGGATTTAATGTGADMFTSAVLRIGGNDDWANMYLAAVAIYNGTVLSQAQIEGIATAKTTASMNALSPTALYDASNQFATNLANPGTFDRTSLTGTTSDADNPSGWVYGLAGGNIDITGVVAASTASGPTPGVTARPYVLTTVS